MKAREYIGKDGRTYRWRFQSVGENDYDFSGYRHEIKAGGVWCPYPVQPKDWLATKAALDALIEEEVGEWVELSLPENKWRMPKNGDGNPQWWDCTEDRWYEGSYVAGPAISYRKGRSVALEQVKELVEAVLDAGPLLNILIVCAHGVDGVKSRHKVERIQAAAKALKP